MQLIQTSKIQDNQNINYVIDRAKRKNVYICIKDGKVILKVPQKFKDEDANKIISQKEKWILKKLNQETEGTRKEKELEFYANEKFYRKEAINRITKCMEKMIALTGLKPSEYRLFNFKTAWGNCSSKGKIKINTKLVMYSDFAIEYVCLHELCHLKQMNHSKQFWKLVEKYIPNYKEAEKELK